MGRWSLRVLAISLDRGLAEGEGYGDVVERHKAYAGMVDRWETVVMAWGWFKLGRRRLVENAEVRLVQSPLRFLNLMMVVFWGWRGRKSFDVITAQDPFMTGLAGWLIKVLVRKPLNIQLHSDFFQNPNWVRQSWKNRLLLPLGWWLLRRADSLRVDNRRKKIFLEGSLLELRGKIFVAPMAVDLRFFAAPRGAGEEVSRGVNLGHLGGGGRGGRKFTFIFVGRLSWEKNLGMFLRAFAKVNKHYPETRLVMVGEGEERRRLEVMVENLGLGRKAKFAGFQPRGMVREYLWRSDVFVLPSWYEGWGLVAVEAAATGLPVIMSDTGCAGEAIVDGESGLVVPVGDQDKLEEKMIALINDRKLYERLAKNGPVIVRQLLEPGRLKKAWIEGLERTKFR